MIEPKKPAVWLVAPVRLAVTGDSRGGQIKFILGSLGFSRDHRVGEFRILLSVIISWG